MASLTTQLSTIDQLAQLAGLFNWQMTDGSFTNANGLTTSFHIIDQQQIPVEQYIAGAINTYNLITGAGTDPNQGLFNTNMVADRLNERVVRKYTLNRVPYANYDQPVDLGVGSQRLRFNVVIAGTMYLTAALNLFQCLFAQTYGNGAGLGTLTHPFYGTINNVLPVEFGTDYTYQKLNCVICELVFLTSDTTHLNAASISSSIVGTIGKYFIGTQNAITSMSGTVAALKSGSSKYIGGIMNNQQLAIALNNIIAVYQSCLAFFYQNILQTQYTNNKLKTYPIDYTLLLPASKYIKNLNAAQVNAQMQAYVDLGEVLIISITSNVETQTNLYYEQIQNQLNISISQLNGFALTLLDAQYNQLFAYTVPYDMGMTEVLFENGLSLDTYALQISLNYNLQDFNNILRNTKVILSH